MLTLEYDTDQISSQYLKYEQFQFSFNSSQIVAQSVLQDSLSLQ